MAASEKLSDSYSVIKRLGGLNEGGDKLIFLHLLK
jgi:hypothetical protein